VAPCAHTWHYKCIRPLLEGKNHTYPQFQCPNCRAYWDLNADVDVDVDMEDDSAAEAEEQPSINGESATSTNDAPTAENVVVTPAAEAAAPDASSRNSTLLSRRHATNPSSPEIASVSNAIDVPGRGSASRSNNLEATRTQTPDGERVISGEGPLTPRNDAGPFILDGSAGRASGRRVVAINEVTEGDN
jgi:E3 ubiquitin-protein ligase DMA1/2